MEITPLTIDPPAVAIMSDSNAAATAAANVAGAATMPSTPAIIAVVIAGLITLITGGLSQVIWMFIVVIILQQIDANIINPKIIGQSLKISPLLVIFAVTVGGAYFGVLGMFLAVPVAAVLKIVVNDWIEFKNKKKYA